MGFPNSLKEPNLISCRLQIILGMAFAENSRHSTAFVNLNFEFLPKIGYFGASL
jgi:hypothetical protein